jgi:hypothetical protein
MKEFIAMAAKQFGMDESKVSSLTGGILDVVQSNSNEADFNELKSKVPGLGDLLGSASGGSQGGGLFGGGGGGGLLGGLASKAASALGGSSGGALDLVGLFTGSGLNASQGGSFLQMLVGFLKQKAGPAVVEKILAQVPQLKSLLG